MKEKAQKFVYLNTRNYISYNFLKNFYWYVVIIPFFMIVMGIYLLKQNGINYKSLFPLISIIMWTLFYWVIVLSIKSKHCKKSFELRFFVNGTVGVLISSLMWIFFASWNLMADTPFLNFDAFLCIIPVYLLASVIYIFSVVVGVHQGVYARIKMKGKTIAFLSTSVSLAAGLGMIASRLLRETAALRIQHFVMTVCCAILIFVPILAHINFVQYFYCKKYNIKCDENGETMSTLLYSKTVSNDIQLKEKYYHKKNTKIIRIMLLVIGAIFLTFCLISFTKGFIQGFIQGIT